MNERLIIVGLINSTEYLQQIREIWNQSLIESDEIYTLSTWCIAYFDEYGKCPGSSIEDIFEDKEAKNLIPQDSIEFLWKLVEDLAVEYDEPFNLEYVLARTEEYFRSRALEEHQKKVKDLLEDGDVAAAEALTSSFSTHTGDSTHDLDLGGTEVSSRLENAFSSLSEPIIEYPGALGRIFNNQLVRGAFVSLMGSEKRGKSFWLLDMAIRAAAKKYSVAFFQAGDMTEDEQLIRVASYLTKLPTDEQYTGNIYIPHVDCLRNQLDECDKEERRCGYGAFTGGEFDTDNIQKMVTRNDLIEAYADLESDYRTCTICEDFKTYRLGTPWLVPENVSHAVTLDEAVKAVDGFFKKKKRKFRLSTHANDTLTVSTMRSTLDRWERSDGFVPDVIVIDYADLLVPEKTTEFRHGQNEIWKNLRGLSQLRNCLVLTATQADGKSYEKNLLTMSNYSEDKRKYAHVTAMFGLNQDKMSREKKLGLMRVNQMVIRKGEFDITAAVTVLQSLNLGRPFLDSYL